MKKTLLFIAVLSGCWSCSPDKSKERIAESVLKTETGLSSAVYFVGDSTWTIESRMAHYGVPGVSIAVINKGKIEWVKSYGVINKESKLPVTDSTLFQAGSISKPVSAYGALHLADQGKINLDENVNTYLKSWKLPDNEFTAGKKVALKHLLSHTGGITVHGFLGYSPGLPVPSLLQVLDGLPPANSDPIRVDKEPEQGFRYSGGGYCIMQQMLIDLEAKPFPQIIKESVLTPIGMKHSSYDQPLTGESLKMAASGYLPDGSMTKGQYHTYPEMAAAGLWTTATDLARFLIDVQSTLQGKSTAVLSKAMAEKMLTPYLSSFEGLGLFIDKRKDDFYFGHGGWDEGFSSEMTAHRDKGFGVVVLTNSNHPEFIEEVIHAVARTYEWPNYVPVYQHLPLDTVKLASIRGRYYNGNDGMITVYSENNRLFMKYLRGDTPQELFRITDSTYIRRTSKDPIQFKVNPADGKLNFVFVEEGMPITFAHPARSEDDKVPYEYFMAGDYTRALKEYQAIMKANPADGAVREGNLNNQGYEFLNANKNKLAREIFRINTILYPSSANAYDSYAEACMKSGDKKMAIANYRKSLKLDPNNQNAWTMLKRMRAL